MGILTDTQGSRAWRVTYGKALTTGKDPVLKQVLTATLGVVCHPLRLENEALLTPTTDISWAELGTVPVDDLLLKADAPLRRWSREQLVA